MHLNVVEQVFEKEVCTFGPSFCGVSMVLLKIRESRATLASVSLSAKLLSMVPAYWANA